MSFLYVHVVGKHDALRPAGIVYVDHMLHVQAEQVPNIGRQAVVIAVGGRAQPVELLAPEKVLTRHVCGRVLPEVVQLLGSLCQRA